MMTGIVTLGTRSQREGIMFLLITKISTSIQSMTLLSAGNIMPCSWMTCYVQSIQREEVLMQKLQNKVKSLKNQSSPVEELPQILKRANNFLHFILHNALFGFWSSGNSCTLKTQWRERSHSLPLEIGSYKLLAVASIPGSGVYAFDFKNYEGVYSFDFKNYEGVKPSCSPLFDPPHFCFLLTVRLRAQCFVFFVCSLLMC